MSWKKRLSTAGILAVASVYVFIIATPDKSYALTDTFNTSGTWNVPGGVYSATVEIWGGGGAGGAATGNPATGGGGAGGAYSVKVVAVSPGNSFTVTVGTGGAGGGGDGGAGNDSWFDTAGTALAKGGAGGIAGTANSSNGAGATGSCTGCIGDTTYAGGSGGTGNFTSGVQGSGAGGGGAGSSGVGGNATVNVAGTGTGGGGDGAAGVGNSTAGNTGNAPGGGGSGAKASTNANRNGGSGADGRVTVTYTVTNLSPAAPTLITPSGGAAGVTLSPQFTLRTTDSEDDYLRYRIILYQSNCSTIISTIDQTLSQTGWSGQDTQGGTAYIGNSVLASSTIATYTYQGTLNANTTYCWAAQAVDPAGNTAFGSLSATQSFTTQTGPAAPTLVSPTNAEVDVNAVPVFTLRSTDANDDYLRYKIELCSTSNCSVIVTTIDQTASQTGWSGQDTQGGTAYVGNSVITSSTLATFTYQDTPLTPNTQYWWRGYTIDPGGTDVFSAASGINSFTTLANNVLINGGTVIQGGTRLAD